MSGVTCCRVVVENTMVWRIACHLESCIKHTSWYQHRFS